MPTLTELILSMKVEGDTVVKSLDDIATKYGVVSKANTKYSGELAALKAQETELAAARAKTNNPSAAVAYEQKLKAVREEMAKLVGTTNQEAQAINQVNTSISNTSANATGLQKKIENAFDVAAIDGAETAIADVNKEIEETEESLKKLSKTKPSIEISGNVPQFLADVQASGEPLRKQIRLVQDELLKLDETSPEFEELKGALGEMKDRFSDFKEDVAGVSGDALEQVGENVQGIAGAFLRLDFGGVIRNVNNLSKNIGKIDFKTFTGGIGGAIKAFANLGKALLLNPIFLIATVIILIIVNFKKLTQMGGIVGKVFSAIGDAIDFVIQAMKDFSDWIGLTNFALEDQAEAAKMAVEELDKYGKKLQELNRIAEEFKATQDALRISQIQDAEERAKAQEEADKSLLDLKKKNLKNEASLIKDQIEQQKIRVDALRETQGEESEDYVEAADKLLDIKADYLQKELELIKLNNDAQIKANNEANAERAKELDRVKKYLEDRRRLFEQEAEKLRQAQLALSNTTIETQLEGAEKVKASFKSQREQIVFNAEADKKAAAAILNKADARLFDVEVAKRVAVQLQNLTLQEIEAVRQAKLAKANESAEFEKKIADTDIAIMQAKSLKEIDLFDQRLEATKAYYDERIKAATAAGNMEDVILLGMEQELALATIRKERLQSQLRANEAMLSEEQRHQLAMLDIQGATEAERLDKEIAFEQQRLENMKASGAATEQELIAQSNKVVELEAQKNAIIKKMDEEKTKALIDGIKQVFDATVQAAQQLLSIQLANIDRLTQAQQKRVEDARELASSGNAELLQLEEERLQKLQKERERFVRAQQALAVAELIANSAVAISKAAAQGGAAAPFTIAATLIALVAGLAQARSVAAQAAFYSGGEWNGEGYTGDGNAREVSMAQGRKPYTYHKREFIFNNEKTSRYRDIFQGVHKGNIDLHDWREKATAYDRMMAMGRMNMAPYQSGIGNSAFNEEMMNRFMAGMSDVRHAIEEQDRLALNIDSKGFSGYLSKFQSRDKMIKKLAR